MAELPRPSDGIALPIAANRASPIYAERSSGVPGELGDALVFKDTSGQPMFRLALTNIGEWRITPLDESVVVQVRKVALDA